MVSRAANTNGLVVMQLAVDESGAAATVDLVEHGDSPVPGLGRIAAERVLADEPFLQHEIDVGSGLPIRQWSAIEWFESQFGDALGDVSTVCDAQQRFGFHGSAPDGRYRVEPAEQRALLAHDR